MQWHSQRVCQGTSRCTRRCEPGLPLNGAVTVLHFRIVRCTDIPSSSFLLSFARRSSSPASTNLFDSAHACSRFSASPCCVELVLIGVSSSPSRSPSDAHRPGGYGGFDHPDSHAAGRNIPYVPYLNITRFEHDNSIPTFATTAFRHVQILEHRRFEVPPHVVDGQWQALLEVTW